MNVGHAQHWKQQLDIDVCLTAILQDCATHKGTHLTRAAADPGLDMRCRDTATWNGFVAGRGRSEEVRRERVRGVAGADGAGAPSSRDTRAGDAPWQVRYRLRPCSTRIDVCMAVSQERSVFYL